MRALNVPGMKELEDLPWFPARLRAFQMEFIGYLAARWPVYDDFVTLWRRAPQLAAHRIDLCSGSGEPAITLHRKVGPFTSLTLTDRYPERGERTPPGVTYSSEPLDARRVVVRPGTCYTMFNAFHHFTPQEQVQLVRRLDEGGAQGWFVEILEPTLLCMVKVLLATTLGVFLLMPFVRPFSWGRLFFTYIIPLNVLTITWDGLVSLVRARTAKQYRTLLAPMGPDVQVFRLRTAWLPLTVIHIRKR